MPHLFELESDAPAPDLLPGHGVDPAPRDDLLQAAPDRHLLLVDERRALRARASCWWGATPPLANERVGLVGHYAAADSEAATTLLERACVLLERAGCTIAIGPMDGSTWRRYRCVIERGTEPPFFLEPDTPDDAPRQFETAGFHPLATYSSAINTDLGREDPGLDRLLGRFADAGTLVRPFDLSAADDELRRILQLSLASFRRNYLYTPIGETEFLETNRRVLPVVRPELVLLAERQGQLTGFLFALPDVLEMRRAGTMTTVIIKTVAVASGREHAGLGGLLVALAHREAHRLGFTRAIHALMHEGNASRNISRRSASTIRRYALFARRLAPSPS